MKIPVVCLCGLIMLAGCRKTEIDIHNVRELSASYPTQSDSVVRIFCETITDRTLHFLPSRSLQSIDSFNTAMNATKAFEDGRTKVYYVRRDSMLLAYQTDKTEFDSRLRKNSFHILYVGLPSNAMQSNTGVQIGMLPSELLKSFGKPHRIDSLNQSSWEMTYSIRAAEWVTWELSFLFQDARLVRTDFYADRNEYKKYF